MQVFSWEGTGGTGSPFHIVKNQPVPPFDICPFFWTRTCSPNLIFVPKSFFFLITVFHQFWQHLDLKTMSESFILCLKHQKWVNFCLKWFFWLLSPPIQWNWKFIVPPIKNLEKNKPLSYMAKSFLKVYFFYTKKQECNLSLRCNVTSEQWLLATPNYLCSNNIKLYHLIWYIH